MGVKGLSTFVKDNQHVLLTNHRLHGSSVIIDGFNLIFFLLYRYKVPRLFGGGYGIFAEVCREFFTHLQRCKVTPYIVFDGGYAVDRSKLATLRKRAQQRRRDVHKTIVTGACAVCPILAEETFKQVLVELDIAHVACHFEADKEMAVLAKQWKCPVITGDSDFLAYGLEGGVILTDYVDVNLHVFDKQTKKRSKYVQGQALTEQQITYIPVKIYKSERFTNAYPESLGEFVLPVFATVLGNDLIDNKNLASFYKTLEVPKCKTRFYVPKTNERVLKVVHWLESLSNLRDTVDDVIARKRIVNKLELEKFKEKLLKSINGYQGLQEFSSLDLSAYFHKGTGSNMVPEGARADATTSDILDHDGVPLPRWFLDRCVSCEISDFVQNAAVLQWNIFYCQLEPLDKPSSYLCSTTVRQVIYGILRKSSESEQRDKHDQATDQGFVEIDKDGMVELENVIEPLTTLPKFGHVPYLRELVRESTENRRRLLFHTLDAADHLLNDLTEDNSMSRLVIAMAAFWMKNARPQVPQSDANSVFLCMLFLHLNRLETIKGSDTVSHTSLHADIDSAFRKSSQSQLNMFKSAMAKIARDDCGRGQDIDFSIIHGFAQFQTCFKATTYLNQLLSCPIKPLNPGLIFDGFILYHLHRFLLKSLSADLQIEEMLGRDSPFYELFKQFEKHVVSVNEKL